MKQQIEYLIHIELNMLRDLMVPFDYQLCVGRVG